MRQPSRGLTFVLMLLALLPSASWATTATQNIAITVTASTATFPLSVSNGVLQTASGQPYLILADSPQGANSIPLCSAGNTYAACSASGDTIPTNATFVAYVKDRAAQGFNSLWINIACESYTACANNGATQEGTFPFTTQLTGSVLSGESCPENGSVGATPGSSVCWDLSTAGGNANGKNTELYWEHIDGYFKIAADHGLQVLANPVPTDACQTQSTGGSFAYTLGNNYVNAGNAYTKITSYANFLAKRYKNQPNIIWFLGNDYDCFETVSGTGSNFTYVSQIENSLYNFALALKTADPNHIVGPVELNGLTASLLDKNAVYPNAGGTNAWSTLLELDGSYENQGPPYDATLMARALSATIPVLLVEGDYQGEDIGGINDGSCTTSSECSPTFGPFLSAGAHCGFDYIASGSDTVGDPNACPFRERVQFWWHMLAGGAAGYLDGNHYTWSFETGWNTTGNPAHTTTCTKISPSNNCLDTAANANLKNGVAFLKTIAWYKLVPDVTRSGGGTAAGVATPVASPFVTGCYPSASCASTYYLGGNHVLTDQSQPPKRTLQNAYPGSGVASDGSFAIAYVPGVNPSCNGTVYPPTNCNAATGLQITANNAVVNGGANLTAAWYDPSGSMTSPSSTVCSPTGTPCSAGSQAYTTPASAHADGTADWILLVTRP